MANKETREAKTERALAAAAEPGPTVHVRVTDSTLAPALISYLDRLGMRAVSTPDGTIKVSLRDDDMGLAEARLEMATAFDSWTRRHGVPIQLS